MNSRLHRFIRAENPKKGELTVDIKRFKNVFQTPSPDLTRGL